MAGFEERLAIRLAHLATLALVGVGCKDSGNADSTRPTVDLTGICEGEKPPVDYQLATGFVTITPGGVCPDAADAQLQSGGCPPLEFQGITCGFTGVQHDQVRVFDGYGGYWADTATAPTATFSGYGTVGPVVDVCFYEGVFYLPPTYSVCGRPLLRDGEPVVATVRTGPSSWSVADPPITVALSPADRGALADHWLTSARLEHASIASFSRFTLDLLRFGAPPGLLQAAHRAALDEIEHARLCFALASAYAGAPLGPGPLDADGAVAGTLVELAEAVVREGCVGETLAAVDAAARLVGARDPAVRAALETIVRDESAHAALAWRALRWILDQDHDGAIRARLDAVVAEERARWTATADGPEVSDGGVAHGLLGTAARARELARTWDEVIGPSWRGLGAA